MALPESLGDFFVIALHVWYLEVRLDGDGIQVFMEAVKDRCEELRRIVLGGPLKHRVYFPDSLLKLGRRYTR